MSGQTIELEARAFAASGKPPRSESGRGTPFRTFLERRQGLGARPLDASPRTARAGGADHDRHRDLRADQHARRSPRTARTAGGGARHPARRGRDPAELRQRGLRGADGRSFAAAPLSGVEAVAFGDLFLEDVRAYREDRLAAAGKRGLFPLWGRDTARLAREFLDAGFEATLVCVDPRALDPSFAGRRTTSGCSQSFQHGVDPCGENGEFHTFVSAGPIFAEPIACETRRDRRARRIRLLRPDRCVKEAKDADLLASP